MLVCAADHGHVVRGTSLFDTDVSAQVAAAAARGETAVGVLARRGGHELLVADVGLVGATPPGVRDVKIAAGSADMTAAPALTDAAARRRARDGRGARAASSLVAASTASCSARSESATPLPRPRSSARLRVLATSSRSDAAPASTPQGLERKRATVAAALAFHTGLLVPRRGGQALGRRARDALRCVGGLELAALAGAIAEAARLRLPVLLDGYAVTAAALAAVRLDAAAGEVLIASHRSAEPGHDLVLTELGLEPLLDLRLRLGEASGALLALPLIEAAGALHAGMGTFEESGVARAR